MVVLLRQGNIFAPEPLGIKDILILDSRIGAVTEPGKIEIKGVDTQVIDASGKTIIPGFIDSHVHILGGGGEGGPATRAPEISVENIISCGVTTVIGCLGTDGTTRHMESLLAKARALEEEGITAFIFSGSYEIPVKTLTGSIQRDLVLIDKVLGAGEIAISDHRSSQPTFEEISRLAAECRVGGMLGGKAGILHLHVGDGKNRLNFLFKLIKETEIPPSQVIPTHVNRNRSLFNDAVEYVLSGGYMDITAGIPSGQNDESLRLEDAIRICLEKKVPLNRITVSSDSNGSLPVFDNQGKLIGLTIASQKELLEKFRCLVQEKVLSLENCVKIFSTNPANFYKLSRKGEIKEGKDADILVFDSELNLSDVFSRGKRMLAQGKLIARSTFSHV